MKDAQARAAIRELMDAFDALATVTQVMRWPEVVAAGDMGVVYDALDRIGAATRAAAGLLATNADTGEVTAKKPACRCACHEKETTA